MSERLFGIETEYAFATLPLLDEKANRESFVKQLMKLARQRLPHLKDQGAYSFFLTNGARFYLDCGSHPEITTPECPNPWDIVRYIQAGERILANLAREMVTTDPRLQEVMFLRSNVDYSGTKTTWGSHESYLHRADPAAIPARIIPHLVSRVIYTGAGGFDALAPDVPFTLSPRTAHLQSVTSSSSTQARGIFHSKNESLSANGYHRLHLLCGESLCSELATFLKVGVTALIVAMIEANLKPGNGMELADPLAAMRRFSADPTCRATASTTQGALVTAIQIQRHYLQLAEAHMHDEFMPLWADRVCAPWREILDRIEQGAPDSVATRLDWAIKLSLFRNWTNQKNAQQDGKQNGERSNQLRQELFEIDTRFGQIKSNGEGIFAMLDRTGALQHHFPGVDNIEHAMAYPPAIGRAGLRGNCVRRFAGENGRYRCDWTFIWDFRDKRFLDLSEPFEAVEKWQEASSATSKHNLEPLWSLIRETYQTVETYYARGRYESAYELLCPLQNLESRFADIERCRFDYCRALMQARRGYPDAIQSLNAATFGREPTFSLIAMYVVVHSHLGIAPKPEIAEWIRRGKEILAQDPSRLNNHMPSFHVHLGYTLLRRGQPQEALQVLQQVDGNRARIPLSSMLTGRLYAEMGEAHRMLGDRIQAVRYLRKARRLQMSHSYEGDMAEFTFAYRAKVEPNTRRALAWLDRAKTIQTRLGHRMGEARTLLLQTRITSDPQLAAAAKTRILELKSQLPALAECKLLAKVLDRWDEWTGNKTLAENGDSFWGV